jgi:hypothetical protein
MRVLLDECLPRGLKAHLSGHDVVTVPEAGWAGMKNGELLRAAAGAGRAVDVFVTIDKSIVYQQQHLDALPSRWSPWWRARIVCATCSPCFRSFAARLSP